MSEELKTKIDEYMQRHETVSMCLTFRHDFGLLDQNRRKEICDSLDGVFRHHVKPKMAEIAALKKDLETARAERNRAEVETAKKYQSAAKALQLLRTIMENATVYEQKEDGTRQWCSDLNIYLRGNVGMLVELTKDEKKQIDDFISKAKE